MIVWLSFEIGQSSQMIRLGGVEVTGLAGEAKREFGGEGWSDKRERVKHQSSFHTRQIAEKQSLPRGWQEFPPQRPTACRKKLLVTKLVLQSKNLRTEGLDDIVCVGGCAFH